MVIKALANVVKCNFCKTKLKVAQHYVLSNPEGDGWKHNTGKLSVEALFTIKVAILPNSKEPFKL